MTCDISTESFWDMHTCHYAYEYAQFYIHRLTLRSTHACTLRVGDRGITITSVFSRKWNTEFLGHNLRKVKAMRHKFCILSWLLDMACKFACVNFICVGTQAKLQGSWTYWNKICWTGCDSVCASVLM